MPFAHVNGIELYYERHGDGPPIVLSHGLGANHITWWQQVLALRERFTVVTFDHRGFGRSGDDGKGATAFVDDLAALLESLGIARAAVVGTSMGGFTAAGFASRFPQRVSALVLACTPAGLVPVSPRAAPAVRPKNYLELTHHAIRADGFIRRRPDLCFLFEQLTKLNDRVDIAQHFPRMMQLRFDAAPIIAADIPVFLLSAEEDESLPDMKQLAGLLPKARFEVVEGTGHLIYFEQADVFNRLVGSFLERHVAAASGSRS